MKLPIQDCDGLEMAQGHSESEETAGLRAGGFDGPTLKHPLQEINGSRIELPRQRAARPDPTLLEVRWRRFLEAS